MKTVEELFPNSDGMYNYYSDYQPILEEFGSIIIQVDDEDYQGDSRVLYKSDNRYGYLNFGWGSCSGCDALQACNNNEDVQELMDALYAGILWFDSSKDMLKYFKEKDWECEYSWHHKKTKEFVTQVIEYLKEV